MSSRRTMFRGKVTPLHFQRSNSASRKTPVNNQSLLKDSFRGSTPSLNSFASSQSSISTPKHSEPFRLNATETNDFAYNDYLIALYKNTRVKQAIKEQQITANDQLDFIQQELSVSQLALHDLTAEIDGIESNKLLQVKIQQLKDQLNGPGHLNTRVLKQIEVLLNLLEVSANKLYLKYIVAINDQSAYNQLEQLIKNCACNINLLINNVGNMDGLDELSKTMQVLRKGHVLIEDYCNKLDLLEDKVLKKTLKTCSNLLAAKSGNRKELKYV